MQVPSEVNLSRRMLVTNSVAPTGSPARRVTWLGARGWQNSCRLRQPARPVAKLSFQALVMWLRVDLSCRAVHDNDLC